MKNKKYLEAAEKVVLDKEMCCIALQKSGNTTSVFKRYFRPKESDSNLYGANRYVWFGPCYTKKNQLARSLALLFMYEMGEE